MERQNGAKGTTRGGRRGPTPSREWVAGGSWHKLTNKARRCQGINKGGDPLAQGARRKEKWPHDQKGELPTTRHAEVRTLRPAKRHEGTDHRRRGQRQGSTAPTSKTSLTPKKEGRRRRKPQRAAAAGRPERSTLSAPEERITRGARDRRATPVRDAHGEVRTG